MAAKTSPTVHPSSLIASHDIGTAGLTKLAKNCGSLKSLSLANSNRIAEATITEFLHHCSSLTSLSLQGCVFYLVLCTRHSD